MQAVLLLFGERKQKISGKVTAARTGTTLQVNQIDVELHMFRGDTSV